MYKLLKNEGSARRGEFSTVHGTVQTPAFMNVATAAAIKGGLSAFDLKADVYKRQAKGKHGAWCSRAAFPWTAKR